MAEPMTFNQWLALVVIGAGLIGFLIGSAVTMSCREIVAKLEEIREEIREQMGSRMGSR